MAITMASRTSFLKSAGVLVTEAGIAGAPLLPMFIFVTTIFGADGRFGDVLPFVLFYSFLKTSCYAIRAFGKVGNPFRLAQLAALVVAAGSAVTVFGPMARWCYDVGAILIGAGLSVFVPMYKTVKDVLRARKAFPYHMETPGFLLMIGLVALILVTARYAEQIILVCYFLMALTSIASIHGIVRGVPEAGAPLFARGDGRHWHYAISSLLLLVLLFFIRLFKQTANLSSVLVICLVSTVAISLTVVPGLAHGKRRKSEEFHEFFYGEVIVLLILYNVFYFTCLGKRTLVFATFGVVFLGMAAAQMLGRKLVFAHPDLQISNVLMLAIMIATLFLFLTPLYFPTLFAIGLLICLGFMRMAYLYRARDSFPVYERRLESDFAKNLGIIVGQWILLGVLTVVSYAHFHSGNSAILDYVDQVRAPDATAVFHTTLIVCLGLLWAQVVFFIFRELANGTAIRHVTTPDAREPNHDLINPLQ